MSTRNSTIALHEILAILSNESLPDIQEGKIELGNFQSRVSLEKLRELFPIIKIQFVSSSGDYCFVNCKINEASVIVFNARVAISELKEVVKTTTTYEIPEAPLPAEIAEPEEIPMVIDREPEPLDLEEDVTISITEESEPAES